MLVAVLAVVLIVILAAALVLVLASSEGSNSPEAALRGYVGGINSGDGRAAFDHTVLKFMPGYEQQVSALQNIVMYGDPHIIIKNVSVVDNASMTQDMKDEAVDIMNEILAYINITVEDMAFVEYNMTMEFRSLGGGPEQMNGEMLCVKIDGSWYLAMPSFMDSFSALVDVQSA